MEPHFNADLPPDVARLRALRRALTDWLVQAGVEMRAREALILATHEAAANAVQHARAPVHVAASRDADSVTVVVADEGRWKESEGSELRGRGLPLMRGLMSNVDIVADTGGSVVKLRLAL